jgi:flagellar basal body-associated protein FliL
MPMTSRPTIGITIFIIIITIGGLASSFWFSWSALIPLMACFGGMVVFLGLWIEKEADESENGEHLSNFIGEKRENKIKSEIGWWILMVGIFLEIGTGAGLAAYDVWKSAQTANAIATTDPLNQPIVSATAVVTLVFSGETNLEYCARMMTNLPFCNNMAVSLTLCRLDKVKSGINMDARTLRCSYCRSGPADWLTLKFEQGLATSPIFMGLRVRDVRDLNVTSLCIPFLRRGSQIVGGSALLTVNSTSWNISIPPQKTMGMDEDWVNFCKHPFPNVFVFGK